MKSDSNENVPIIIDVTCDVLVLISYDGEFEYCLAVEQIWLIFISNIG